MHDASRQKCKPASYNERKKIEALHSLFMRFDIATSYISYRAPKAVQNYKGQNMYRTKRSNQSQFMNKQSANTDV